MKEKKQKKKRSIPRKIINGFILFFAVIVLLLVLLMGFSQTSTFRSYFKDEIVSRFNSSTNGSLSIGEIDGTILSSLFLRDIAVEVDSQKLISANLIEVKVSPLQLFVKKLYFRKVGVKNADIFLLEDKDGKWVTDKLFPKSEAAETVEKKEESKFPFLIQANNLYVSGLNFVRKSYAHRNSDSKYDTLNFNDFRLKDFNLNAKFIADINNLKFDLIIDQVNTQTNLTNFNLNTFNGRFLLNKKSAAVQDLKFVTEQSDIRLNAELTGFNLKDSVVLADLEELPVTIDLQAEPFEVNNLSTFLPSMSFINGAPKLSLKGKGTFGKVVIDELNLAVKNSFLNLSGRLTNLEDPSNLFVDADITDSKIYYQDVIELLPSLNLQKLDDLHLKNLNINFKGKPQNFAVKLDGAYKEGKINLDSKLDFTKELLNYDVKYKFSKLDLTSVLQTPCRINSEGTIKGRGIEPRNLQTDLSIKADNSFLSEYKIDDLSFKANAKLKKINVDFEGIVNNAKADFSGNLDFTDNVNPGYDLSGTIDSLHLPNFVDDTTLASNLNFNFDAKGKSFNLDSIEAEFKFGVYNSVYKGYNVDSSNIIINLQRNAGGRQINLTSDFVDLSFGGDFSLNRAVDIISYETSTISQIISDKLTELNPLNVISDSVETAEDIVVPEYATKNLTIDFSFKFKDFDLIAVLLEKERIDVGGSGEGRIENTSQNFTVSTDLNVDYALSAGEGEIFYISNLNTHLNFSRDNRTISFDNLFGSLSINGDRVFAGTNVENIESDIIFNQSKIFFNVAAVVNSELELATDGNLAMFRKGQHITMSNLSLDYKNINWSNRKPINLVYGLDSLSLKDFVLHHDSASIGFDGHLLNSGEQNIDLAVNKMPLSILNKYISGKPGDLRALVNMNTKINGTFEKPEINTNLSVTDLSLGKMNYGSLLSELNYSEETLDTDIKFVNDTSDISKPRFTVGGTVPINLSFTTVSNRLPEGREVDLSIRSKNFNLQSFGSVFPFIKNQKGNLLVDIRIDGGFDDLNYDGFLIIRNGFLTARPTNLDYNFGTKISLEKDKFTIDSLIVHNSKDVKNKGELWGRGFVQLDNNNLDEIDLAVEGNLTVLGQESKNANKYIYGDLYLGSKGPWRFTYENGKPRFSGNIELKRTDMVFVADQSNYAASSKDFVYKFLGDTTQAETTEAKFEQLLSSNNNDNGNRNNQKNNDSEKKFDYDISVTTRNDMQVDILLSRVTNQKLMVEARGDLKFESRDGKLNAQGSLELLEGSKLEFFKTLDATGTIRFESDLTDPYLDITATYRANYALEQQDKDVAVKIKLTGPVSELGKNLANNPENISVYVGSDNIENNLPDRTKDASDAIAFILVGKFKDDLTRQDKERTAGMLEGATNSLVGSVLTSYLNSTVGDIITSVSIGETRYGDTQVSLTGRAGNFRYRFGGTQAVLQDLARANLLLQYYFSRYFLIKAERKEPIGQTFGTDDKITEIGLKYKFEF